MAVKRRKRPQTGKSQPPLEAISGFVLDESGAYQKLLNDRVRLGVLSSLAVSRVLTFRQLRDLLGVTDGNLSTHARKLEEAGFVRCEKSFDGRIPKTEYSITPSGQTALKRYLKHMEALINATSG